MYESRLDPEVTKLLYGEPLPSNLLEDVVRHKTVGGEFRVWSIDVTDKISDTCECHRLVWPINSLEWGWGDYGYTCPLTRNETL